MTKHPVIRRANSSDTRVRPRMSFALVLACAVLVPHGLRAAAYVRVNQVGYDAMASKRAYLMSSAAETGATFRVIASGGGIALTAPIGSSLGAWSSSYPYVYALDFGSVSAPGTYSISVAGPLTAVSPSFRIDTPTHLYAGLLPGALFFFEAQRDGEDVIAGVMDRRPSHLNDRSATVFAPPAYGKNGRLKGDLSAVAGAAPRDCSGGWFDAGDYIKLVQTTSYALDLQLLALRDFPSVVGPGSSADLTDEARFGLLWLQRMWDDGTRTLHYQVGIGDGTAKIAGDHDLWRLPEADDTYGGANALYKYIRHRPLLRAAAPGSSVSPNLAGRTAAAFALCYQVYRSTDPALADQCLLAGEHVFDLANTSPGELLTVSPHDFYPETEWRDDLELGATELYSALAAGGLPPGLPHGDPAFYLQKASHWAHAYIVGPNDAADTLNLYDTSGLAHYELHRAITAAGNPAGLEVTQGALLADIRKQVEKGVAQAATDPFAFGFPFSQFDAVPHGLGLSILASEYDELTSTTTYADFGRRQLGVVLGSNAWGSSFVVGAGTTFPHCMQHQIANLSGSLDGAPPMLEGAAVNGPNGPQSGLGVPSGARNCPVDGVDRFAPFNTSNRQYKDNVISWPTVEPALDFTAATLLAFARQAVGRP